MRKITTTLICVTILAVATIFWSIGESFAYDLTGPFDLTLRLGLEKTRTGYAYPGILVGEARGDLRELPARLDVGEDGHPYWYGRYVSPCCRRWEADGWSRLSDREATNTRPFLDNTYRHGGKPLAGVWALNRPQGTLTSPTIYARFTDINHNATDLICLKILAKVPEGAHISVIAQNIDQSGAMEIGEILGTPDYEWALTRLVKVKSSIPLGHVRIKLIGKQPDSANKVLVQWTTFCADESELHDYYASAHIQKNSTTAHYSLLVPPGRHGKVESRVCLNGGSLDLDLGVCQCAPGFAGAVCGTSCGPNRYGVQCTGTCSPASDPDHGCRGVLSCSDQGCACFAGLGGDACDEDCPPGYYGSDCRIKCGACEEGECDRYSGKCPKGCSGGRQAPLCQEECGRSHVRKGDPVRGDFFWDVGIYEKTNQTYSKVCGASLVRPGYLLTAARCFFTDLVQKPSSDFMAVFGHQVHCFREDALPTDAGTRSIVSVKVPPQYHGSHVADVALVQLDREVPPEGSTPLCYQPTDVDLPQDAVGFVAGWHLNECGSTIKGFPAEVASCLEIPDSANDTNFCVKVATPSDLAEVESIGSGFVYNRNDDWYIYGVKSGASATASIYTKVSDYTDWMTSTWNRLDVKTAVKENIGIDNEHQSTDDLCSS